MARWSSTSTSVTPLAGTLLLDAAEAKRGEYGFLTPAARTRATLLKPGSMILSQPEIPVPLLLRFPYPAWATRRSEVGDDEDPFARFEGGS